MLPRLYMSVLKLGAMRRFDYLASWQRKRLWHLKQKHVPCVLLQLIALVWIADIPTTETLDFCEFFAGQAAVTNAVAARGWITAAFEIKRDAILEDILSRSGFGWALILVLRLKPGAALWFRWRTPMDACCHIIDHIKHSPKSSSIAHEGF